jgi:hypothetical protein
MELDQSAAGGEAGRVGMRPVGVAENVARSASRRGRINEP